jgi:hypothetical protein
MRANHGVKPSRPALGSHHNEVKIPVRDEPSEHVVKHAFPKMHPRGGQVEVAVGQNRFAGLLGRLQFQTYDVIEFGWRYAIPDKFFAEYGPYMENVQLRAERGGKARADYGDAKRQRTILFRPRLGIECREDPAWRATFGAFDEPDRTGTPSYEAEIGGGQRSPALMGVSDSFDDKIVPCHNSELHDLFRRHFVERLTLKGHPHPVDRVDHAIERFHANSDEV